MNMSVSSNPSARLGTLLFSGLFALMFTVGGIVAGVLPLARMLHAAWQVQAWQPVSAQVLRSELSTSSSGKGGTSYKAVVHYRYAFAGHAHESTRIGLDTADGADNLGSWQRDWHLRLSSAMDRGQPVTAWVNPDDPSAALLDRSIRWSLLFFHLPFAFVFTGVGLVAAWFFLRTLRVGPDVGAQVPDLRNSASRGQGQLWFVALFWSGISFPMAVTFWLSGAPWWVNLLLMLFVGIGLVLLGLAVRQSALAWRYAGSVLRLQPSLPRAGESLEVVLALSPRAVDNGRSKPAARRLRLAHYRVDDSGSGVSERLVEHFDRVAAVVPDLQGGERWQARFDVPADAPTHGGRRSRERVDWRLEVLAEGDAVEVSFDVPVQATPVWSLPGGEPPDRFDPVTTLVREQPIAMQSDRLQSVAETTPGGAPLRLPTTVRMAETFDAFELQFAQAGWRWFGVMALITAVALVGHYWWLSAVVLWWALHALSRRHSVRVLDEGLELRIASWMGTRICIFPLTALDHLSHKALFAQTASDGKMREFHAVYARESAHSAAVRLTPGLPGPSLALAVARVLQQAREDRAKRFSAGALRSTRSSGWRPGAGWLLWTPLVLAAGARAGWLAA